MNDIIVFLAIIGIIANAIKEMRRGTKISMPRPTTLRENLDSVPNVERPSETSTPLNQPIRPTTTASAQGGQPRFSASQEASRKIRQEDPIQTRLAQMKSPNIDNSTSTADLARLRSESDAEYARDRLKLRQENEADMVDDAILRGDFSQENSGNGRLTGTAQSVSNFATLKRLNPLVSAIILSQVFTPARRSARRPQKQSN